MSLFGDDETDAGWPVSIFDVLCEIRDASQAQNVLLARIAKAMENLEEHLVEAHT